MYFQELYAGSMVYEGELNMFRAVTDQSVVSMASPPRNMGQLSLVVHLHTLHHSS